MLLRLIPKIFYADVEVGIDLFVRALGFEIGHRDDTLVVVARDGAKAYLVQDAEFAAKDRPEIAIETDTIDALYAEIRARAPERLHPNLAAVTLRPWGAREFGMRDASDVCVVFRQWPDAAPTADPADRGVVTRPSAFPFDETVQRLVAAFAAHGIKVFATIDQKREAAAAGLDLAPTTLIVFGNPKAGTPLMQAAPESALDLPLRVAVLASPDGAVSACFNAASYIVRRHALPEAMAAPLAAAETVIERALQG
jgi:uncharacterized protein (DUF302 family)